MQILTPLATLATSTILFFVPAIAAQNADDPALLTDNIRRGSTDAIRQAVKEHRVDLIPVLEEYASKEDAVGPPKRIARIALAKLGVKAAYEEIVADFTTTNTALYRYYSRQLDEMGILSPEQKVIQAQSDTQMAALDEFIRLGDESTVKYIAGMLVATNWQAPPMNPTTAAPVDVAAAVLWKMQLHGVPLRNVPTAGDAQNSRTAWRDWWEQNKDYYEKLEFGKPPPPPKSQPQVQQPLPPPVTTSSVHSSPGSAESDKDGFWNTVAMCVILIAVAGLGLWWMLRRRHASNRH